MKMKFILIIILSFLSFSAHAADISLFVDGEKIICDVAPVIVNDRTLVPARALFESLGAVLSWNDSIKQATISHGQTEIKLTINSSTAYVNGAPSKLDAAPIIINSRTMMPVRFISQTFEYDVDWNDAERSVYITSKTNNNINITSVDVSNDSRNVYLKITFDKELEGHNTFTLNNPTVLALDLYDCSYNNSRTIEVNKGAVKKVRMANHEGFYRIAVDMTENPDYTFSTGSDKLSAVLTIKTDISALPPANNPSNEIKRVVIDAGHGGSDSGAIGYEYIYPEDGSSPEKVMKIQEKTVNLDIASKVADFLRENGIEVYETRTSDATVSLKERYTYANELKADLFVSVHCNSFTSPDAKGTLTIYSKAKDAGYPNKRSSKEIASIIQKHLQPALNTQNRNITSDDDLAVLKHTVMPAVLIETAFISNPDDMELLMNDTMRTVAAKAIAEGILEVINGI